jgi:hypothetical protein
MTRRVMKNGRRKCKPGYTHRKGYIRKNTGTRVKGVCVRSQSPHRNSLRANESRRRSLLRQRLSRRGKVGAGSRKRCGPGEILRSAYVRKISSPVAQKGFLKKVRSGKTRRIFPKARATYVKATCVKDLGKPGKLPEGASRIGPLRKGELSKHGYSYKLPEQVRRNALQKAVNEFGALSTFRKLNAVAKLTERTNPVAAQAFSADRNWIRQTYEKGGIMKAF